MTTRAFSEWSATLVGTANKLQALYFGVCRGVVVNPSFDRLGCVLEKRRTKTTPKRMQKWPETP